MKKIVFLILLLFPFLSFGEISCSLERSGCLTTKGIISSKTFQDKFTVLYLGGIEIKKLKTSDVDNAFAYYDITYDSVMSNKRQNPSRLILSYIDDYGCISGINKIRCKKIFVVDLSKDRPIISNEITTPVQDSMMMYVDWEKDFVIMRFEDHSKFIYKKRRDKNA
ncbi:hypothetical protein ABK905_00925 [Acerihabitans sp. KWT182]|uniref:Uncharacterized protein n=1 Tax=Acerihabitans sp. KWT182 TaxID=3157919 RepID=A0AAU7QCN0_9GAMM